MNKRDIVFWAVWFCAMITMVLGIMSGNNIQWGIGFGIIIGVIIAQIINLGGDLK